MGRAACLKIQLKSVYACEFVAYSLFAYILAHLHPASPAAVQTTTTWIIFASEEKA